MKRVKTLVLQVKRIFSGSQKDERAITALTAGGQNNVLQHLKERENSEEGSEHELSTLAQVECSRSGEGTESDIQAHNIANPNPASACEWKTPRAFEPELEPVLPLSKKMLPAAIYGHIFHEARRINNAPPEYVAVSLIVSAAAVIGASASITPKRYDSWSVQQGLWGLNVGHSSDRKSPCMAVGISLITEIHERIIKPANINRERNGAANKKLVAKQVKKLEQAADKALSDDDIELAESLFLQSEDLQVNVPRKRDIVINDATPEALLKRVESNPNGVLVVRDEFFGLLNRLEKEENSQERSIYLEAFNNNSSYVQERISREPVEIERLGINILGGIQPGRLLPLLRRRQAGDSDDGFFERLQLVVYPDSNTEITDIAKDKALEERAIHAFSCFAMMAENDMDVTARFSETAQLMFDKWCSMNLEKSKHASPAHASVLGKYPSLLARLSHIFHLFDEADNTDSYEGFDPSGLVGAESLQTAINLMELLESHSRRVQSYWQSGSKTILAESLLPRLKELETGFDVRTLQRKGWAGLSSSSDCKDAIAGLVQHGYLRKISVMGKSKRPSTRYDIHPEYCGIG